MLLINNSLWLSKLTLFISGLCLIAAFAFARAYQLEAVDEVTSAGASRATKVATNGGSEAVDCDVFVNTRAALDSAVQDTANSGKTICVTPGNYGTSYFNWTVDQPAMMRVIAQPDDRSISIPGAIYNGASNITIEGFDIVSGSSIEGTSANIRIIRNHFHDFTDDVLDIRVPTDPTTGHTNIEFSGNLVERISYVINTAFTGYGIQTFGGPTNGFKANYNTFNMDIPAHTGGSGDAMQLGDIHNFEIIGNVITGVRWWGAEADDPHSDSLMVWAGAANGVIKDNRILDGTGALMSGSTHDIVMQNNLIARIQNYCHDGGTTGSSSDGLYNYTWRQNTIWQCGNYWNGWTDGGYGLLSDGPVTNGGGNILDRNLLAGLYVDTNAQFSSADHNLIQGGSSLGGTNITFDSPTFADTIDYLPTNLPAGYTDVGYRVAPAGYQAYNGGTTNSPPVPQSVVSRKTHGTAGEFDIDLPLVGTPGIESRSGGASGDYEVVLGFANPVTVNGNPQAEVTLGIGGVPNGGAVNVNGSVVTVPLTNVASAQTIVLTLFNVNDGATSGNVVVPMSILVGDTTANGQVNASDIGETKARSGDAVTSGTFRNDVTVNGSINTSDIGLVKSMSGTSLP